MFGCHLSRMVKKAKLNDKTINITWDIHRELTSELARREFREFISLTKPDFFFNWHHEYCIKKMQLFAEGKIKNLMILLPTQTGKSEMATRRLPAYLLGINPDEKIGIASYSGSRASAFNLDIQRIIDSDMYKEIFPGTKLSNKRDNYKRTGSKFEIVGRQGSLEAVGVNGPFSGSSISTLILDDTTKDHREAVSIKRQSHLRFWWDSVAKTRLDNKSKIMLVNTRWDEDDLAGYIQKSNEFDFEMIIFPALKVNDNNPDDPREIGEALWEEKHSRARYEAQRLANPVVFEAIQQQNPGVPTDILVYPKPWHQIDEMPGYSRFYGLDFGYSVSPDCLVECMVKDNRAYLREIFYNTGNDTDSLSNLIKVAGAEGGPIFCDKSQPRLIEDLKRKGINARPAIGGPGSLIAGILYLQSLDISLTADSTDAWLEKKKYQWPLGPDNKPLKGADPLDNFNHFMDAARYGIYSNAKLAGLPLTQSKGDFY